MTLVHRRLEIPILACRLLPRKLLRGWRHFLGVRRSGLLFRIRLCFHPIGPVKAGMAAVHLFIHHRAVDVGVMDDGGVHTRYSGVVAEGVSFPSAAPVAISVVAITAINASIKTDSRSPVTLVQHVCAVAPAPPGRGPKHTH